MKLLFINQYFPPDRAATGMLLGQLAESLARQHDVSVICGTPTYAPESPAEIRSRVTRIPLLPGPRSFLPLRLLNYLFFLLGAAVASLRAPAPDAVICWTDPPLIGLLGVLLKGIRNVPLIFVSQDVYPEVVVATGRMNFRIARCLLTWASRQILRSADAVVSVGRDMSKRLLNKGCPIFKLRLIPNWQDLDQLQPGSGERFRKEHQIPAEAFVVMHSGNIGFSQDLETLIDAAERTREDPMIRYLLIGDGGRQREMAETIRRRGLINVLLLPYQPTSLLASSLSAADVHYVSLLPALVGVIVPSKVYGILAVGKPIFGNLPADSEAARVIQESGAGVLVESGGEVLANALRTWASQRPTLTEMGRKGRAWIEANGGRERAVEAYARLLEMFLTPGFEKDEGKECRPAIDTSLMLGPNRRDHFPPK